MIEVISVNPINKGDMLASVSVAIKPWKLKIHEITVMQKGVNRWVNLPQRKYEANGETKYAKQLEFDDAGVEKRFRDQIMAAVDEYIMRNGDLVPEDVVKEEEPFITWSWIWVTAPLWIPLVLVMFIMSIVGVCACVALKDKGYNVKKT